MSAQTAERRAAVPGVGAARALRVLPLPTTEPPVVDPRTVRGPSVFVQGSLAVDFSGPGADPGLDECEDHYFAEQPTPTALLPDPCAFAVGMVRTILEAMDGLRPPDQLARYVSPDVYATVHRRARLARRDTARRRQAARIRTVHVCQPADGVAELAVVLQHRGRVRALALRLRGLDGRWRVCAFELG